MKETLAIAPQQHLPRRPPRNAVRIREFYRLASQIQNRLERDACTIVTPN
jgi:hypothetical protein